MRAAVGGEQPRGELEGGAGRVGDGELRRHRVEGGAAERDRELDRLRGAADEQAAGRRRRRDRAQQGGWREARLIGPEQGDLRLLGGVDGHHLRGRRHRVDRDRHRRPYVRRPADRGGRPGRDRLDQVHPHVTAGDVRRLVGGGPGPALVLRERQRAGGDGHHQQQRGAALAQRLAAELPAGHRRGEPAAGRRQPVDAAGGERQQPQRQHRAACQGERGGEHEHRVDGRRAARPDVETAE